MPARVDNVENSSSDEDSSHFRGRARLRRAAVASVVDDDSLPGEFVILRHDASFEEFRTPENTEGVEYHGPGHLRNSVDPATNLVWLKSPDVGGKSIPLRLVESHEIGKIPYGCLFFLFFVLFICFPLDLGCGTAD
ncbi:hypothetical protein EDC01DRAFT_626543 [Geopyxis carbonaria]|nr:hypothetical protein EDC01DRAFT_626543 [Geopyxis carbonaria]